MWWLIGCPNPRKMEQSWECTFLKLSTHMKTQLASKIISIIGPKKYQLVSAADLAHQGWIGHATNLAILKPNDEIYFDAHFVFEWVLREFQKSALLTLFHFVGVRTAYQPNVKQPEVKFEG